MGVQLTRVRAAERRTHDGRALAVLRPTGPGKIRLTATAPPWGEDPLRHEGSADEWAIGIYKASTGQYSETELFASFGGATGTPEQGVDETFIGDRSPGPTVFGIPSELFKPKGAVRSCEDVNATVYAHG
jgi:hypothetical protein